MKKIIAVLFLLIPLSALGTIQVNTTRVIFDELENEQTVEVNNVGKKTALIQVWLSEDDSNDKIKDTGFIITQPIFKVKPEKSKVVRIIGTDEIKKRYPKDRETMLWINFLDIPPENENGANSLSIAVHTKMKFFYMPEKIDVTRSDAAEKLTWKIEKTGKDSYLIAKNNSPIYVSLGKLVLKNNLAVKLDSSAVSPFGETKYKITGEIPNEKNVIVEYSYIDDLGAYISREIKLT
ncbi:molecular chaperone [Klebsiella sp. BIGb0407]|uniref:fimbrial biogenesis chaperone n=1 Tax=Klebsiella sp. BIGb0407 TaxID=2940603 RepID=UPI002169F635|nr:molecular chaperone [Klebsiella sp. BIGb0407]MCS3433160.1 chaperone protein EcpD [Klebsiella sp. BIGb0407]